MTRTTRHKIQYAMVWIAALVLAGVAVSSLRDRPVLLLGVGVMFLIPGRLSGFLWRDLYCGRRLLAAGDIEASLQSSQRFISLLAQRPRLRRLWWLSWGIYSRDPKAMALNNVGAVQLNLGRFDEAESAFRESLAADPDYPIPHFNLAVLSTVRGDASAAEEHARTAVKLGYARDAGDRIIHTASALLARIEGHGPTPQS